MFNLFKKKKEEPKPLVRTITEINYLADTENADKIYKLVKDDLNENPEYSNSAKELKEYYDHEKVYKYDPYELPFEIKGKQVFAEEAKRYVLLNKPVGYVCSMADEKGRPIAADLLKEKYSERLYNVGRLDMFSCGLIIFTNDGDFAKVLSHPSAEIEKEYVVDTSLPLPRGLDADF